MRKKLTIDKWYGGMSCDPSIGGVGTFNDGRGIEIRKNSRNVRMSTNNTSSDIYLNSRSGGYAVGAILPVLNASFGVVGSSDGKLTGISSNREPLYGQYYTDSVYTTFYNIFRYNGAGVDYGVIIAANGILRWDYDGNSAGLGSVGSTVVTNGDMSSATGWTVGAGWAFSGGKATHTIGNTATLEQTLTVTNTSKYIVNILANCTAGSFTVSLGGTVLGTITTSESGIPQTYSRTTASTSEALVFTPSSSYDGYIDFCEVKKSNVALSVSDTFTSEAVILPVPGYIYVGNGSTLIKVDTTIASWTTSDVLTIASGYTIKGLSKIGDQIIIYASDGSTGKQYIWDGASPLPEREITWYDKNILRVININNVDYLIVRAANRASLYLVNGYQPELIFQSFDIQQADSELEEGRFAFKGSFINGIETIGQCIAIPSTGGLYTYGNQSPGFPKSLVKEYTWNGLEPSVCDFAGGAGGNLTIFFSSSKSGTLKNYYRAISTNEEAYNGLYLPFDPGFIKMHPFFGTGYSQRKSSVGYKIGAKIPQGTYLNIYSRADDETGYANFYTDPDQQGITTMPTAGAVFTNNGNTYTVTSVTTTISVPSGAAIIHCTYTGTNDVKYSGTLTKTSGTGDSTIKFFRSQEGKLIKTLTNSTRGGQRFQYPESYNKIEWYLDLVTSNSIYTPELYDFQYIFDEVEIDS